VSGLPAGFWWSFGGAVVGGGVAMWGVATLLRRGFLRLARGRFPADARASSIVEVPFALIGLILLTLGISQLTFMCAGYVLVDYAAFTAARSAAVVIPQERMTKGRLNGSADDDAKEGVDDPGSGTEVAVPDVLYRFAGGPEEPANHIEHTSIAFDTMTRKGQDIRGAAVLVLYPASGGAKLQNPNFGGGASIAGFTYDVAFKIPGLDKVVAFANKAEFVRRWVYADGFTRAHLFPEKQDWSPGDVVVVEIQHDFHLAVPFADRLFRTGTNAGGSYTRLGARHACVIEGYAEQKPPDAPEETQS
jgi:hypothetical protein